MHTIVYYRDFESGPLKGTSVGPERLEFDRGKLARQTAARMRAAGTVRDKSGMLIRYVDVYVLPAGDEDTIPAPL